MIVNNRALLMTIQRLNVENLHKIELHQYFVTKIYTTAAKKERAFVDILLIDNTDISN